MFSVSFVVIPCSFGSGYRRFGGTSYLILQSSGHKTTILTTVKTNVIKYHLVEDLKLSIIFIYRVIHSEVVQRK
jgi:hypothetical protein